MGWRPSYIGLAICIVLLLLGVIAALSVLYFGCKQSRREEAGSDNADSAPFFGPGAATGIASGIGFLREGWSPGAVRPCVDFYEYACGNWSLRHPLPPGRRHYDTLGQIRDGVRARLFRRLDELREAENRSGLFPGLAESLQLYESCLNLDGQLRDLGPFVVNPLVAELENGEMGSWPLLSFYWKPRPAMLDPEAMAGTLAGRYGVASFLEPRFEPDWEEPTQNALYLYPADLTLGEPQFYLNRTISNGYLSAYRQLLGAVARELARESGGMLPITASSEVVDIVSLEVSLASFINRSAPANANTTAQHQRFTLAQLRARYPNFHWDDYLTRLLPNEVYRRIDSVILPNPGFVALLADFVHSIEPKAAANYLVWRLVRSRLWALASTFRQLHHSLKELLDPRHPSSSRRFQCLDYIEANMGLAVGRLFVERYYEPTLTPKVAALAQAVAGAYGRELEAAAWLDPETRKVALDKLHRLRIQVAYPSQLLNDSWLQTQYGNLSLGQGGFFSLYNDVAAWESHDAAYSLLCGHDGEEWIGPSPAETNAWYSPQANAMALPAGLLQAPLYRPDYPASIQFGALGAVVGHEMAHAFGLAGGEWEGDGRRRSWLDAASERGLLKRRQCLARQLDSFCYPDIHRCIQGHQVVGEALADLNGLRAAQIALEASRRSEESGEERHGGEERWSSASPPTPSLGGLDPSQTFFLSFARLWCAESDAEALRAALRRDPHPPDKARVIAALSNSKAFAKAFHCAPSDPMTAQPVC